ncbi:MAG: glycerol-3-phosphate 1-O-acyltransferase PlsY [Clostridia bacterium]|nr:glycerol-3-phosphate 1-O-acyltransferase PlsY [Clostridia bacterium]
MLNNFIMLVIAYLVGSVNFSIIFSKIFVKEDVRTQGSGNAGFTNILRNYGKLLGAAVFLCDILKTVLVILIARFVFKDRLAEYCASVGVILGHNYPVFFGFKGGKGVLTTISSLVMLDWRIGIPVIPIAVAIMFITGYVSLGSIFIFLSFPIGVALFYGGPFKERFIYLGIFACVLGLYRHRSNIIRLFKGTENCFKKRKQQKGND